MIYVGIDPGRKGAIAEIHPHDEVSFWGVASPMPLSNGGRDYDIDAIIYHIGRHSHPSEVFVTVERQQPMPASMGGGFANYARGQASGFEWMLVALGIDHLIVSPKVWQKAMHVKSEGETTKERSIAACGRLFPSVSLHRGRSKKSDDGFADALLLAEYGRRIKEGSK